MQINRKRHLFTNCQRPDWPTEGGHFLVLFKTGPLLFTLLYSFSLIKSGGMFQWCQICWTVPGRHLLFYVFFPRFAADLKQAKRTACSLLTAEQCGRSSLSHNGLAAMKHWQHIYIAEHSSWWLTHKRTGGKLSDCQNVLLKDYVVTVNLVMTDSKFFLYTWKTSLTHSVF